MLAAVAVAAALAVAQTARTADDVVRYIRTAIEQKYKDGDVASTLQGMRLSTRLDADAVSELQRLGAGPRTVAALTKLAEASATLTTAPPKAEPATPPAPSPAERKRVVEEVRANSLNYTDSLPNYICRQVTRRRVDPTGTGNSFRDADTIVEQLELLREEGDLQGGDGQQQHGDQQPPARPARRRDLIGRVREHPAGDLRPGVRRPISNGSGGPACAAAGSTSSPSTPPSRFTRSATAIRSARLSRAREARSSWTARPTW